MDTKAVVARFEAERQARTFTPQGLCVGEVSLSQADRTQEDARKNHWIGSCLASQGLQCQVAHGVRFGDVALFEASPSQFTQLIVR